jgi:ferric-dicitrate binding protein FerR (iron transport regulator)
VKQNKVHIDTTTVDRQSKAFFAGGKFNWNKSESDVWATIETQMEAKPQGRSLYLNFALSKWAVAASIIVLLSVGSYMRFYSVKIETTAGQHLVAELPDQSKVNLNAQSSLTYSPFWWKISRVVKLEGEGFFEVEKGSKFTVNSVNGITRVIGTSFNIFARDAVYKVTCVTGSVKVKSRAGFEAILKPGSKAEILPSGKIKVLSGIETFPELSWKTNVFLFTASPVSDVFNEIERQYGVNIETNIDDFSLYTGNFSKDQNVEEILEYVCPAMGLKYIRQSTGRYLIIRENE